MSNTYVKAISEALKEVTEPWQRLEGAIEALVWAGWRNILPNIYRFAQALRCYRRARMKLVQAVRQEKMHQDDDLFAQEQGKEEQKNA